MVAKAVAMERSVWAVGRRAAGGQTEHREVGAERWVAQEEVAGISAGEGEGLAEEEKAVVALVAVGSVEADVDSEEGVEGWGSWEAETVGSAVVAGKTEAAEGIWAGCKVETDNMVAHLALVRRRVQTKFATGRPPARPPSVHLWTL